MHFSNSIMRISIAAFFCACLIPWSYGQSSFRLWGPAYLGDQGSGNIFSIDPDGTKFLKVKSFPKAEGVTPGGKLLKASDGLWYGVSTNGGFGFGVIFKMNADGTGYSVIFSFDKLGGANPTAGLREGTDGFLYGCTSAGGSTNTGVLFKVKKDGSGFQKLIDFSGANGSDPVGSLITMSDGTLYGVTTAGGSNGAGILYKINQDGSSFSKLIDFDFTTGATPISGLLRASDGNLYGLTADGGAHGNGIIFRFQINTGSIASILDLNFASSGGAWGDLIQGADSKLYGISSLGPAFSLNLDGTGYTLIYDFSTEQPAGNITQMSTGEIVGMTQYGGALGTGMLFKLTTSGYTKLLDLSASTGQSLSYGLQSAITEFSPGVMLVLANGGGPSNNGTIFSYNASAVGVLKQFPIETMYPRADLMMGIDGGLYGVAEFGGAAGAGVIFKVETSGTYTKLFEFDGSTTGANPRGRLVQNSAGVLFGTTSSGGTGNTGTIFKINANGTGFTKLFDFDDFNSASANGRFADGGLFLASDNYLYGICSAGGSTQNGTVYKIQQDGSGFTNLHTFATAEGARPYGSLVQADNGILYGVTRNGGANAKGSIYKITMNGTFTKLLDFNGTNGSLPTAGLLQASDGFLYGTTYLGGSNDVGTIFKIDVNGLNFSTIVHFDANKGAQLLRSTLTEAPDGFLYGVASAGGSYGVGTIYKVKKDGTSFTKILDEDVFKGCNSIGGLLVVTGTQVQPPLPTITSFTATSGFVGASIQIVGTGFDPIPGNNIVKFNGVPATITSSSATSLTVTVPTGATTGTITVTSNGMTASSTTPFVVLNVPTIISFTPSQGPVGTVVTLTGKNFSDLPASNIVAFNSVSAVVTASTATSITTTVPAGASTGPITISVNGQSTASSSDFTVTVTTGDLHGFRQDGFIAYPNPAKDEVVVVLDAFEKGKSVEVAVYDLGGRQLEKFATTAFSAVVDIRSYNRGTYVIKVIQGEKSASYQLVKN